MSNQPEAFTIGVEEEYQIIHPQTRQLRSRAQSILKTAQRTAGDQVTQELYRSQIEIGTPVCQNLSQVRQQLLLLRRQVIEAARQQGCLIAAAGTHPFSHWQDQQLTHKERYQELADSYQQLAREQLIFGCHVHVGIPDREMAIQVMNRSRPWLALLLALSTNSPFWLGDDTGYASFRTQLWGRWPLSGPPLVFDSRAEYDGLVEQLVGTHSLSDASKIYWDVRPSLHYETLEFRVADVCLTVDEAVMIAGLIRGLASTCAWEARQPLAFRHPRPELLRASQWRAARYGLSQELVDVQAGRAVAASWMVAQLLAYVRPALEAFGEWEELSALVEGVLQTGTGAARQRQAYASSGTMEGVVDFLVAETAKGS